MPKIKDIERIGKRRVELLDRLLDGLRAVSRRLEDWLSRRFIDDLFDRLQSPDAWTNKEKARRAVSGTSFKGYYQRISDIIDEILRGFGLVADIAIEYGDAATDQNTKAVVENERDQILRALGLVDGRAVKGGYIDALTREVSIERRIRGEALRAIQAGVTWPDFKNRVAKLIKGDRAGGKLGIIEAHYYTNANTMYAEFDRALNLNTAEKYELTHAIWSGPILKDSRAFCRARKGKVFSRAQLLEMNSLNWQGKIPGQNVLVSAGGYNCVDILLWISRELAELKGWQEP